MKEAAQNQDAERCLACAHATTHAPLNKAQKRAMTRIPTQVSSEYLKSIGCDLAQGYYLARPLPSEEVEALLAD